MSEKVSYRVTEAAFFGIGNKAGRVYPGQIVVGEEGLEKTYTFLEPVEKKTAAKK